METYLLHWQSVSSFNGAVLEQLALGSHKKKRKQRESTITPVPKKLEPTLTLTMTVTGPAVMRRTRVRALASRRHRHATKRKAGDQPPFGRGQQVAAARGTGHVTAPTRASTAPRDGPRATAPSRAHVCAVPQAPQPLRPGYSAVGPRPVWMIIVAATVWI